MMAWRWDSAFDVGPKGSPMWAHTYLVPNDCHGPWHGDSRTCTHKRQMGKIVHTHLRIADCERALRFTHVVCESWGPMCISYIP